MEDILDILAEYSMKYDYLDTEAITKIIKLYKKEFDISILSEINIYSNKEVLSKNSKIGCYADNYINIYYNRLLFNIKNDNYKSDFDDEYKLSVFEGFFRRNLFILFNICHEMEHAIQEQTSQQAPRNLEDKLVGIENDYLDNLGQYALDPNKYNEVTGLYDVSYFEWFLYLLAYYKENKIYDYNYSISLLERLADIDAMEKLYKMCEAFKSYIPNLYILMEKMILDRKIRDYDSSFISPTTEFFLNLTGERQYNNEEYSQLSFEEKLRLGLPVDKKEIAKIELKLKH